MMTDVLQNQGIGIANNLADSVEIELHEPNPPYALVASNKSILQTNGQIQTTFSAISGSYYIVIKHRNSLTTWSANPITFGSITNYDFTNASSKAYGNNMIEVDPGIWAIYTGDILSDDNIDLIDLTYLEVDLLAFLSGYYSTDLNGDGNVDLLDFTDLDENISNFIYSIHP